MPKTNRPNNISLFSALEILGLKDLAETNPALIHGFVSIILPAPARSEEYAL